MELEQSGPKLQANKTKFPSKKSCTWEKVLEASFKLRKALAAGPKEREGPSENRGENRRGGPTKPKPHIFVGRY